MKRGLTITIVFLGVLYSTAFSQDRAGAFPSGWRIELEIGKHAFPGTFNDFFGLADWNQKYAVRVGFGKDLQRHITGTAFVEYRRYASETTYGDIFPWEFLRSYARTEVACYTSLTFLGFLEAGVGAISQSHEEILYNEPRFDIPVYEHKRQPAAHRIKLFYIAAVKYEIPLGARFYAPISLSMDMFLGHYDIQSPTLRVGLAREFN
jgi:hypothetical protein